MDGTPFRRLHSNALHDTFSATCGQEKSSEKQKVKAKDEKEEKD
jgi:hypothetical protein